MRKLFVNIKELVQVREGKSQFLDGNAMKTLPTIKDAFLLIEDEKIIDFGNMDACPTTNFDEKIDLTGKMVFPSWVDSHTHIVYAGNREGEFVSRINGMSYEEIAKQGGGILNSAILLQNTSEEELYEQSKARLEKVIMMGTGAVEIKSGYGLTLEAEMKMLRVIKKLVNNYPIPIRATFLGAHAFPKEYKNNKAGYIELICNEMIPQIAAEELATYIDVFCETGYFSVEETQRIISAGKKVGLIPKIHVNQFTSIGGVQMATENEALSIDHLEVMTDTDIENLSHSKTIPVALPGCSFFLGIPYTPARKLLDKNIGLALATDYNPGSCPSGNMNFVVSTACIKMKMTPEESINAATINAAFAMGLENEVGSIAKGKLANFFITKSLSSYASIPYSFGDNLIDEVYLRGDIYK